MKQGESLPLHHRILLQRHRHLRNIITIYHEPPNSEEPYVSSLTNLTDVVAKIHRRSNQQNNFYRFQHLPVELQIEVWKWTGRATGLLLLKGAPSKGSDIGSTATPCATCLRIVKTDCERNPLSDAANYAHKGHA
ncbi:hypothetical protein CGCSCA5_v001262 [Colletotrichum siamense]|nr:hypothetical protein CGCSCA5_v001262 [Colletotrichum siamense]